MLQITRLYLALVAWALWMGGFALYFGVVVPTGGKLLGETEQGFVTQQVTHWLNVIGTTALTILLWEILGRRGWLLIASWVVLAALQAGLFAVHWQLDLLIDTQARSLLNESRFRVWHEWYEFISAIQWFTGMVHLAALTRSALAGSAKECLRA